MSEIREAFYKFVPYLKIFITLFVMVIIVIPLLSSIFSKRIRNWLRAGIEGENSKLDLNEVWEVAYLYMALGSYLMLIYMIVIKTLYQVQYSWEEYMLMFFGTAGSNGVAAFIIYIKQKGKDSNENG
ncbi:MAG TPA: hypothetical protein PLJ60_18295 [Chryseolinea sp.]|nr:hypothetical protein [Flavobacteriales bacterium]HPM32290.1 hypothetical protein [Chryseolinea sp.]